MSQAPFTSTIEDPSMRELASAVYDIDQLLISSEAVVEDLTEIPPNVTKALGKIGVDIGSASDHAVLHWQLYENNPGQSITTYGGSLWHGYVDSNFFKVFEIKEIGYREERFLGLLAFRSTIKPDFTIYEPGVRAETTRLVEDMATRSNLEHIFAQALDYPR